MALLIISSTYGDDSGIHAETIFTDVTQVDIDDRAYLEAGQTTLDVFEDQWTLGIERATYEPSPEDFGEVVHYTVYRRSGAWMHLVAPPRRVYLHSDGHARPPAFPTRYPHEHVEAFDLPKQPYHEGADESA